MNKINRAPQNEIQTIFFQLEFSSTTEGVCADSTVHPLLLYVSKKQMHQSVNVVYLGYSYFPVFYSRPPQKPFVLTLTKNNRLNLVPEHDCYTLFILHRTKCKPMHFGLEGFSEHTQVFIYTYIYILYIRRGPLKPISQCPSLWPPLSLFHCVWRIYIDITRKKVMITARK